MRHRREYEKDPNNCIIMFLELAKMIKENGEIDQDNIVDMLSSHFPEISDRKIYGIRERKFLFHL